MSETEGEMWRRLRSGAVLDWANGPTVIDFTGEVSMFVPQPEPGDWRIEAEKTIRADERKLCVEALRAEAREFRECADRESDDGRYLLSTRFRTTYTNIADNYERAALLLERRHV